MTLKCIGEFAWAQCKFAMLHSCTAFKLPQGSLRISFADEEIGCSKLQCANNEESKPTDYNEDGQSSHGYILTWMGQHFKFG